MARRTKSADRPSTSGRKHPGAAKAASLTYLARERGLSQKAVARALRASQPEVSRIERRTELHVSTLRRYVAALGGKFELTAKFPQGEVRIAAPNPAVGRDD